jgi:hypothetical protein
VLFRDKGETDLDKSHEEEEGTSSPDLCDEESITEDEVEEDDDDDAEDAEEEEEEDTGLLFLAFMRRFWNQILICRSVNPSMSASSVRRGRQRYLKKER